MRAAVSAPRETLAARRVGTHHRDVHHPALLLLRRVEERHEQLGLERTGAKRVESDSVARVDHGEFAGHGEDGAFRGGVGELRRCSTHQGDEAVRSSGIS